MVGVANTKFCALCGNAAHKATTRIYNPYTAGTVAERAKLTGSIENWDYEGNQIVVRKDYSDPSAWGSKSPKFLFYVNVWDGDTWELNRDPFCTLNCAESFARAAYTAGYRMKGKHNAIT